MTDTYCYLRLKGAGRDTEILQKVLKDRAIGAWRQSGITLWGIWEGLFGVASNELLLVAAASGERSLNDFDQALVADVADDRVMVVEAELMTPTVRPTGTAPCDKPGLYVFRFFEVRNPDVEEVAQLSRQAWETFENSDAYESEPQGLFRPCDGSASTARMLLVTWYDGLASWQTSRRPAPEAMANFQRRRELTNGTVALATRLVEPFI